MAAACDRSNAIERPDHSIEIPFPKEPSITCVPVRSGDTIILPIDLVESASDPNFRITEADGTLVIEHGGATVLLQDFVATLDGDPANPVVVTEADQTPIDLALWLASSDPNINIITGQ